MRFLFVLTFITSCAYSQDKATVKFVNLKLLKGKNLYFKINGKKIKTSNTNFSILINPKKVLDTIVYSRQEDFKNKWISFAKFKKKKTYIIKINPCSLYEIFPEKNKKNGSVRLLKSTIDNSKRLCFSSDMVEIPLIKENFNKCFNYETSANCSYSYQTFELKDGERVLDSRNFHFLHGERLKIQLINNNIYFKL